MGYSVYPAPAAAASRWERTERITGTQAWVAPADVTNVQVLLISGGGAGGNGLTTSSQNAGGGGGAGGMVLVDLSVTPSTSYTVTIGAGGASNAATGEIGGSGSSSSFGGLLSLIGGSGGGGWNNNTSPVTFACGGGSSGGSGGGGGGGGMGVPYYGTPSNYKAPTQDQAAIIGYMGVVGGSTLPGGQGINNFCGGGGAGSLNRVASGHSRGGNGANANTSPPAVAATAAEANSGSGGGGGATNSAPLVTSVYRGGNGGSGIAVIKYWSAL